MALAFRKRLFQHSHVEGGPLFVSLSKIGKRLLFKPTQKKPVMKSGQVFCKSFFAVPSLYSPGPDWCCGDSLLLKNSRHWGGGRALWSPDNVSPGFKDPCIDSALCLEWMNSDSFRKAEALGFAPWSRWRIADFHKSIWNRIRLVKQNPKTSRERLTLRKKVHFFIQPDVNYSLAFLVKPIIIFTLWLILELYASLRR